MLLTIDIKHVEHRVVDAHCIADGVGERLTSQIGRRPLLAPGRNGDAESCKDSQRKKKRGAAEKGDELIDASRGRFVGSSTVML
jgi:hypothetical protein